MFSAIKKFIKRILVGFNVGFMYCLKLKIHYSKNKIIKHNLTEKCPAKPCTLAKYNLLTVQTHLFLQRNSRLYIMNKMKYCCVNSPVEATAFSIDRVSLAN